MPRRLHVTPEEYAGTTLTLEDERARRLLDVLRLREGTTLQVFDGAGHERLATVEGVARGRATLALGAAVTPEPEPPVALTLCCAFPRGTRADWLIEKATELGVAAFVPLRAERSVLHPGAGRLDRWRRIASEAAEQCGRAVVPAFLEAPPRADLELVATLKATLPVRAALAQATEPATIALYIGPEGDWTEAELAAHEAAERVAVTLGPRVLRVETAALVGLTLLLEATGGATAP